MIEIPKPYAPMLIAAVRDAVIYQEGLLRSETLRDRADHEEHFVHLTQFFEYVQKEYKRHESEIGCTLENLL